MTEVGKHDVTGDSLSTESKNEPTFPSIRFCPDAEAVSAECELRCGKMRFYCTALAVLLALADCFAQQEQRTLQHRMAPMYRMPEPSGTQPHFLAKETHVSAGDPFDDRLAQLLSHTDGGVQTTQAPEADVINPALSLAGLDRQCSSSLLCYCCRWTIRTQTATSACDVPQFVTVEEPVCVQIVDGRCVQTEVQTRQEVRRATSGTCDKQTAQRTCARCCRTHLAVDYASLQCSAPTRVTSQDVALPTPSPHERHTAHRRSVGPYYSPTQAYAAQGSAAGDMRAYRSCCSSASRRACCTSVPVQASSRGASPGSRDALARCCGTGATTAPYSSHATFDAGDAPQAYRPAATCCAAYNPPSCCFSQSANIRAFCCQDDRGAGRQAAAVEVAPPSCCTSASRMSCCEAAAPSVRPQCCTSRAASRQEMGAALTAGVGQVSEDECCSVDISVRSSCCRRFSSPELVRCCYRVDIEPQQQAPQPAVARTQPECCTTRASLRDACCSAAMASIQQVRCCTRVQQQQPSAALMPAASDCCTTGSGPRPACCRTTYSQAARATCCDSMLHPAQDTCCSSSTAAALLRCCAAILHPFPCCATRLVAAPLPTTTTTTTTTTTLPPPETPPLWSLPCCTASSPSFRDACCASVSVQLVILMPCCTQTRAFSSALMSSCCTAAQAQSPTPCCSTSSSTERDGSVHTVTRCCSSSSSSSSSSYQSSYQSPSVRDASPSCCGRTGVVLGSCCAVYGGQQRALPRCCASTSALTSHMSSDAVVAQRDLSCCTRSSSDVAQCCASLPLTADFPPCCSASSSSSSSHSALAARQQPQPASCCTGTALARAQCCSSHTLTQSSAPSCCSSSLQSASAWAALPGQQAAPSCCHTTASSRLPCCASSAYLASCCQNIRRMYK